VQVTSTEVDTYLSHFIRRDFVDAEVETLEEIETVIDGWRAAHQEELQRPPPPPPSPEAPVVKKPDMGGWGPEFQGSVWGSGSDDVMAGGEEGKASKFCIACGVSIPVKARFCPDCGEKQA
jgi:hypothetical protein